MKCSECGSNFERKCTQKQYTCSPKCSRARVIRKQSEKHFATYVKKKKSCAVCGAIFTCGGCWNSQRSGTTTTCSKKCSRQWTKLHNHAYYLANKEHHAKKSGEWRKAHPESRTKELAYRKTEDYKAKLRIWARKNKDRLQATRKRTYQKHRDKRLREFKDRYLNDFEFRERRKAYAKAYGKSWRAKHRKPLLIEKCECGKFFTRTVYNRIYCSLECRREYGNKKKYDGVYGKKYRAKHRKPLPIKNCLWCGNRFTRTVYNRTCCSQECRRKYSNYQQRYLVVQQPRGERQWLRRNHIELAAVKRSLRPHPPKASPSPTVGSTPEHSSPL